MSVKVKTIVNLTGQAGEAEWDFQAGKVAVDLDRSNALNLRGLQLSSEGVTAYKGSVFVCIPKAELWKLLESVEEKFKYTPPTNPAPQSAKPVPESQK